MTDPWVCIDCGHRQASGGACMACGREPTLDARVEKTRELMFDVDLRLAQRREGRFRLIGVVVGLSVIFGLWLVPGWWTWRNYYALPFFADQWLMMALIGLGLSKLLEKRFSHKRFPYLRDDQTMQ